MFKKCKVVMLPTEKASNMWWSGQKLYNKGPEQPRTPYQHLYIISDDVIKEDDWLYNLQTKNVRQCFSIERSRLVYNEYDKKIIATTDKLLAGIKHIQWSKDLESKYDFEKGYPKEYYLPQPSQSFIEKYIEQYNNQNIITDVMVEYEGIEWLDRPLEYFPKINLKDNTITIKRIKDTFTRKEVIELLHRRTYETTKDIMDTI